eukprot:m.62523 g.62523  ORF g.62523 m.62523 type:complete len:481 (+) comp11514_c0_seq2:13-1455(+)
MASLQEDWENYSSADDETYVPEESKDQDESESEKSSVNTVPSIAIRQWRGTQLYSDIVLDADGGCSRVNHTASSATSIGWDIMSTFLQDVFLPQGYPDSVSDDYATYQFWDSAQALCSYITGTLASFAVLKGVGVGDSEATAAGATLTYLTRDGTGMLGRIMFAWYEGTDLDYNAKQWRLVADILNDLAQFIELVAAAFPSMFVLLVSCASLARSIVGVAGGATRATVTSHQAKKNNMGDVAAKDGSQETCVNLIGLFLGYLITPWVTANQIRVWAVFFFFTSLHLYSNYKAVVSLRFEQFNARRASIAISNFLESGKVPNPSEMQKLEPIFMFGRRDFTINLGVAMNAMNTSYDKARLYLGNRSYLIFISKVRQSLTFNVVLHQEAGPQDCLRAYFECFVLGKAAAGKVAELNTSMANYLHSLEKQTENWEEFESVLQKLDKYSELIYPKFSKISKAVGWDLEKNQLSVGTYRVEWEYY